MAYDDPGNWRNDDFSAHFEQLRKRCAARVAGADSNHFRFVQDLAKDLGCPVEEVLALGDEAYALI